MDFEELITVWYPQAVKINETKIHTEMTNLGRIIGGVR